MPGRAAIAWTIAVGCLAAISASLLIRIVNGDMPPPLDVLTYVGLPLSFGSVGALLTVRVPANPIGPLFLVALVGLTALVLAEALTLRAIVVGAAPWVSALGALVAGLLFIPSIIVALVSVPLRFPDGRLLSRRWGWVELAAWVTVIGAELKAIFAPGEITFDMAPAGSPPLVNPFGSPVLATVTEPLATIALVASIPLLAATGWSLVIRYRRGDDIARHQIRWLAAVVLLAAVAFTMSFATPGIVQQAAEFVAILTLIAIPLAIGIAVVRYHLYEIDRLISRGISYGIVTVLLVAAYGTSVLLLTGPLGMLFGDNAVAVAISTLVVAGLFQPIRARVQRMVDRRFDRARIDADRTASAFADRLRDQVDMDAVRFDLAATVDGAMRPAAVGLWLRHAGR